MACFLGLGLPGHPILVFIYEIINFAIALQYPEIIRPQSYSTFLFPTGTHFRGYFAFADR